MKSIQESKGTKGKDKVSAQKNGFEAHAKAIVQATRSAAEQSITQLQAVLLAASDTNNNKATIDALGKAVKAAFIAAKCPEKTARVYASEAKSIATAYWVTTTFLIDGTDKPIKMTGGEYFSKYAPGYNTAKRMAMKIKRAGSEGVTITKKIKGRKPKPFLQKTPETKGDWIDVLDKVTNAFRTMQGVPPETVDYLLAARKAAMGDTKGAEKVSTFRRMKDLSAAVAQVKEAKLANHKDKLKADRAKAKGISTAVENVTVQ
jgi:hypothetical protein